MRKWRYTTSLFETDDEDETPKMMMIMTIIMKNQKKIECKIINDCDNENIYLDFHWKLYVTVDNNEPKKDKCEGNFLIILWFSWRKI